VPPELSDLTDQISLTPYEAIGIPLALIGAVFLALGTQFQHRGVAKVERNMGAGAKAGLSPKQLQALLGRPSWVAIVFQLTSLNFSPLIVVQPLGAVALVVTAIVNSRMSKVRLTRRAIRAILFCVLGIALFVGVAAFHADSKPVTEAQLITVLILLGIVLVLFAVFFVVLRKKFKAVFYILGAGVLFGFVATLAKTVIDRIKTISIESFQTGEFEWLTRLVLRAVGPLPRPARPRGRRAHRHRSDRRRDHRYRCAERNRRRSALDRSRLPVRGRSRRVRRVPAVPRARAFTRGNQLRCLIHSNRSPTSR
jgi:hypothetical protein